MDLEPLSEPARIYIAQVQINDWPSVTRCFHLRVIVIDRIEQGATRHFQIFDIVAVPNNFHRIKIKKLDLYLGLRRPATSRLIHTVSRNGRGCAPAVSADPVRAYGPLRPPGCRRLGRPSCVSASSPEPRTD